MQRVGVLVEVPRLLAGAGVDPGPVLQAAGVHPGLLADADGMLQYEQFSELVYRCVEATGRDDFDLVIGASGRSQHLGVLGTFMACGPTLGSAIDDLVTNHPRYVRGGGPYLLDLGDGDIMVGYRAHSPGLRGASLISRGAVAFGYALFRQISGVTPKAVHMSLPPPRDLADYEMAFDRTPIRFNAEHFGTVFSRASLRTPNVKADPELRRQLAETIAARWAVHQPDVRERVMRALVPSVFSGTHSLESTAKRINMTADALTRDLKEQGCSFRELLVEARLEMASQFLTDARMSIAQIATILGYSEISAFTRFFTSARGMAPAEFRRQHAIAAQRPARDVATQGPLDAAAE
jgi:AraC-like DNA-binding protein